MDEQLKLTKIKLVGLVKALTPLLHGAPPALGESRTNHMEQRKMKYVFLGNEEKVLDVPVISGNSIRGVIRQRFIMKTMAQLEVLGKVTPDIAYFLLAGGSIDAGTSFTSDPSFRTEIRTRLPFIDLLGGSLHGCFIPGLLRVNFMVPLAKETLVNELEIQKYFAPEAESLPSMGEIIYATNENIIRLTRTDELVSKEKESGKMIYAGNALPQGTLLSHGFTLDWASLPAELAFWAFVDTFLEKAEVGGWIAKGFGKISAKYVDALTGEAVCSTEKAEQYREYLVQNKKEITEYLVEELPAEIKKRLTIKGKDKKGGKEKDQEE